MHGLAFKIEAALEKLSEPELTGKWTGGERQAVEKRLDRLPEQLRDNPGVKRIDRQKVLKPKPPGAPGDSKYDPDGRRIVLYDKGVYDGGRKIKEDHLSRSVFHELAHSIEKAIPGLFENWKALSGWTKRGDRWIVTDKKAKFVDDYAKTSPYEDWAETFQEYFVTPEELRKEFPEKHRFVERVIAAARRGELEFKERPR